jgi:methionyl-tRNA synthetase
LSKNARRILVTSALPYANGPIHLGHLAGAYLPADIYVRFERQRKNKVLYICGTDEHGVPITIKAENEKTTPQAIVDTYYADIKESFARFGMSFDNFSRTSSPIHHQTAREFFVALREKGYLTQKSGLQLYCEHDKMFLPDRYVEGTCHHCDHPGARGDQCDHCGHVIDPLQLIDPVCQLCGNTPVQRETAHWYIQLQEFAPFLKEWLAGKTDWKDNVKKFCTELLARGLQERAVTRDLNWGVPVPGEEGKVLYVWFDAPIGYISSTREWAEKSGDPDAWKPWWQDKEGTKLVHFIGKDNIIFHAIMFPAMLHGDEHWVLPDNVPANEFLNLEGNKLSTSKGYAVWLNDFLAKYPADALRYSLAINAPEVRDTDFSWREFQARNNNELADILGNFVNRTMTFASKYFDAKVPEMGETSDLDDEMLMTLKAAPAKLAALLERYQVKEATLQMMNLLRSANKYFNDSEPWKTRRDKPQQAANTIAICLKVMRATAILMRPVLPHTADKIWTMLAQAAPLDEINWYEAGELALQAGSRLGSAEILFSKIEDATIEAEVQRLAEIQAEPQPLDLKKEISIDDFGKIDLRTGKILTAEAVAGARKLLKFQVEMGPETRQIVSGIAEQFTPEELVGRKVILVANLKPAVIRGVESQGMLLMAEDGEKLFLLEAAGEAGTGLPIS